ncbi:hypothetical protein D1818_03120 [Aquimarina sp. BL5]|nr:hypothetical protein D1818_03120 [Aquimarina sp. BL5]
MKITTTIFFSFFFTLATYMISDVDENNLTKPYPSTTQNDNTQQGTTTPKSMSAPKTKIKVPKNK